MIKLLIIIGIIITIQWIPVVLLILVFCLPERRHETVREDMGFGSEE
jgi:hypothetical protein